MNTKHAEIENFKSDIKLITSYAKEYKRLYKEAQRKTGSSGYEQDNAELRGFVEKWKSTAKIPKVVSIWDTKHVRRCMHVAYALLKGRDMDQIEQKSREPLNTYMVKEFIKLYTGFDEIADSFDGFKVNRELMYEEVEVA